MSKDEIKALIASSIEGQGNQVDVASKLATILDAIIDNIPEGGGGGGTACLDLSGVIEAPREGFTDSKVVDSFAELATYLGISEDETKALCGGQIPVVLVKQEGKKKALFCHDQGVSGDSLSVYEAAYGDENFSGGDKTVGILAHWDSELSAFSFDVFTNTAG